MSRSAIQLILILAFTVAAFMLFNFGVRYLNSQRLSQQEQTLQVKVIEARATQTALIERKQYVQTDTFIEKYVRENWHWGKPDDKIVLPHSTPASSVPHKGEVTSPNKGETTSPLPPENSWWQNLLNLILGQ